MEAPTKKKVSLLKKRKTNYQVMGGNLLFFTVSYSVSHTFMQAMCQPGFPQLQMLLAPQL